MTRYHSNGPVTVFESTEPALIAVAKSLLEEADIPFYAKGEAIQNIGLGLECPIELQVSEDDAADARAALIELTRR